MKISPQIPHFIYQSQHNSVWFFVFCFVTTYVIDECFVAAVLVFFGDVICAIWCVNNITSTFAANRVLKPRMNLKYLPVRPIANGKIPFYLEK